MCWQIRPKGLDSNTLSVATGSMPTLMGRSLRRSRNMSWSRWEAQEPRTLNLKPLTLNGGEVEKHESRFRSTSRIEDQPLQHLAA